MTTTTKTRKAARPTEDRDTEVKAAMDAITDAVAKITTTADWERYLKFGARFYDYSFNNQILIYIESQRRGWDHVGKVAAYGKWQSLGRQVIKGEKGIRIFAPVIVVWKEGEKGYVPGQRRTHLVGFRVISVFEERQTTGEPLAFAPVATTMPSGDSPAWMFDALVAFASDHDRPVRFGATGGTAEARATDTEIVINERNDKGAARDMALTHEIAHVLLHFDPNLMIDGEPFDYAKRGHRGIAETEAQAVAYIVGVRYGLDVSGFSAGYIANWARDDRGVAAMRAAGTRIMATARKIIDALEKAVA